MFLCSDNVNFISGQIKASQSLFFYARNESVDTFSNPDFEPMFADNITWHNESLREKAEAQCGDDHECLFDVASTNDLSVGMVTKDISIQLVNESNSLSKLRRILKTCCNEKKFVVFVVAILYFFFILGAAFPALCFLANEINKPRNNPCAGVKWP